MSGYGPLGLFSPERKAMNLKAAGSPIDERGTSSTRVVPFGVLTATSVTIWCPRAKSAWRVGLKASVV